MVFLWNGTTFTCFLFLQQALNGENPGMLPSSALRVGGTIEGVTVHFSLSEPSCVWM